MALRAARHVERAADRELVAVVIERPDAAVAHEHAASASATTASSAQLSHSSRRGADELGGPVVALAVVEEAAAPEVLAGEGVGRGDRVPGGPAAAQVVEGGELAGQLVGLVERGVERGGEADVVGDRGQRRRAR